MGAATGPARMIYRRTDYPQPYFDELAGPGLYPVFHVMADLGAASGRGLIASNAGDGVASLCYRGAAGPVLWLAKLTAKPVSIRAKGFAGPASLAMLDEGTFAQATTDEHFLTRRAKRLARLGSLSL